MAVGGHGSGRGDGRGEWVAVGGHGSGSSVAILAAAGVGGCPVCRLLAAAVVVGAAAAAADDDEVVVEGAVVAVAPLRLPPVEPEEPVVRLRVRLVLLQVVLVQADVA